MTDKIMGVGRETPTLQEIAAPSKRFKSTVEDMVVTVLREAISRGVFPPGAKLHQERIATELGVSRIPFRSALRQLEAEDLVSVDPYRGARVRVTTPDELAEIYELRVLLESQALKIVFAKMSQADVDALEVIAVEMDAETDPIMRFDYHQDFYRKLYLISGKARLCELIGRLRLEVSRYWLTLPVHSDHEVFIKLLRMGDSKKAIKWLTQHLREVSKKLQSLIQEDSVAVE